MQANSAGWFNGVAATPFGAVGVRVAEQAIRELVYLPPRFAEQAPDHPLAERALEQVGRYCADPDFVFDLPLAPAGTAFQQRVWQEISAIPRGEVRTYGALARYLRTAPRAVGGACGANWYPMVIPCHRVVAAGGLGGFSNDDDINGLYLRIKRWLLAHEGVHDEALLRT